jgi:hypothetical protein
MRAPITQTVILSSSEGSAWFFSDKDKCRSFVPKEPGLRMTVQITLVPLGGYLRLRRLLCGKAAPSGRCGGKRRNQPGPESQRFSAQQAAKPR